MGLEMRVQLGDSIEKPILRRSDRACFVDRGHTHKRSARDHAPFKTLDDTANGGQAVAEVTPESDEDTGWTWIWGRRHQGR